MNSLQTENFLFPPQHKNNVNTGLYHHHISVMEMGHLLTRSGLMYPQVSSKVCHDSFCQLGNSVSLPWVCKYRNSPQKVNLKDSSGRVISSSQRPLPDNTQHSQQTKVHAASVIRTHNLRRRAAADLRLRPRGYWDWL